MFYKALGFVVWKIATRYLRFRFAHTGKVALAVGVATVGAAAYLAATRSGSS
jgi:hypothetical protein